MKKIIFLILALLIMVGSTILATKTVTNDDHQHTISTVAEVAPTCTEAGTKAHYKCAICGKLFSDEEGKNEIEAPETIAALGHTEVIDDPVSATCTAEGKTEGKHCSVCNFEIVKQESTRKLDHTYNQEKAESKYLASEATCTAKATYYKSCSCGEKGTETFESGEKTDHNYNQENTELEGALVSAASCTAKAVYNKSCICGAIGTETFESGEKLAHTYNQENTELEGTLVSAASCTAKAVYKKSCICGALSDSETFEFGEKLTHNYNQEKAESEYLASEATCTAKATYYKSCICGEKGTETFEVGEISGHSYTLVATGAKTEYEPGDSFSTDGLTVKLVCGVQSCGHTETVNEYSITPNGSLGVTDSKVTITYGDYTADITIVVVHDHDMEYTAAKAATCETAGNNAYYYCSACENYYSDESGNTALDYNTEVVIAALNHSWGSVEYSWADDNSTCTATRVCANNNSHVETETVNADVDNTPEGCLTEGKNVYTADFTNSAFEDQTKEVTIPAKNHNYSSVVTDVTCLKDGYTTHTCANCGNTYTDTLVTAAGKHTWSGNECTVCGAIKFEAECAEITQDAGAIGTDNKTQEGANYPSGGLLISGIKNANEFKAVFNVYSDADTEAVLNLCMGLREWEMNVARVFKITVNGVEVEVDSDITFPVYSGEHQFFDWKEMNVVTINLKGGQNNVIVIEKREGLGNAVGNGLNFDYISLESNANLQWNTEVGKGHTYEWTVTTSPDYENAGEATSGVYCTTCRLYREAQTEVLPIVSKENNYESVSVNSLYTTWSYTLADGTVVNVDVYNPSETYTFMSNVAGKDPFASMNGGSFVLHSDYSAQTGWDTGNLAYNNTYGGTFTISLNVEVATTIDLYFVLNNPKADTSVFMTFTNVLLDGTDITSTALVDSKMPKTAGWAVAQQQSILVATIELHEGINEITIVRSIADKNSQGYNNLNIRGIEVESTVPVELGGSEEKTYTFIANRTDDLFLEANGGSVSVGNYSSSYGWQQTYGASISFRIYSEKATTVQFYMIISGNKGATTVKTAFTEMCHTANGVTTSVELIDTDMPKTSNWALANANTVLIAEIDLQAGVNEFTLVRNSDTDSSKPTNINIWGVEFVSNSELSVVNS